MAAKQPIGKTYEDALSAEIGRQYAQFQASVEEALSLLENDPVCKRGLAKRRRTILAIADADADPSRSRNDAFKEKGTIARSSFYDKTKDWNAYEPFREVLDRVVSLTVAYEQRKDARTREARRNAHRERMLAFADKAVEKIDKMLDFPLSQQVISDDGRTVTIEPVRWSMRDVATIATTADKVARLALDMDTKRERRQVTDWKDEWIAKLAAGEISADDVTASLPDHPESAAEIIARAKFYNPGDGA